MPGHCCAELCAQLSLWARIWGTVLLSFEVPSFEVSERIRFTYRPESVAAVCSGWQLSIFIEPLLAMLSQFQLGNYL